MIRYQKEKKEVVESIGWASLGYTDQSVYDILSEIKRNIREGKHPQSFKEMREMNEKAKKQEEIETQGSLAERITFDEVFERYFPVHKTETTEKTWQNTERYYRNWIAKKLGTRKLIEITVDDIQPIIAEAMETRTPRTADFVKTVIRQIFNFAKKRDLYFKDNPAMKIKVKQKDNKRNRFLTQEEARILLDALLKSSIDVHDIALISLFEGLRAGEIFNLRWEHIIWHSERISVLDPKNNESRMEPMHALVKETLQRRIVMTKMATYSKLEMAGK